MESKYNCSTVALAFVDNMISTCGHVFSNTFYNYSPEIWELCNYLWWRLRCTLPNMLCEWPISCVKLPKHIPCQPAAAKQYVSVLVSSGLMPLCCSSLFVFCLTLKTAGKGSKEHRGFSSFVCACTAWVEMVIFRKQQGREEGSRWSNRAQLPNEVSLVAPGVKRPCVLLLLSLKKGAALRSISRSIFTPDFYSNISTMA